jgi:hypothetical protein
MIKCKDCIWWDNGSCQHDHNVRGVNAFEVYHKNSPEFLTSKNVVITYCHSDSGVYTGGNFGCIHGTKEET